MLVERVALVASATVAADGVLASAVQAHARELDALVDVLALGEAVAARAQLRVGLRAHFGTQFALVAAPGAAYRAAAQTLREMAVYGTDALPVTVLQVARFLPGVGARRVCNVGKSEEERDK